MGRPDSPGGENYIPPYLAKTMEAQQKLEASHPGSVVAVVDLNPAMATLHVTYPGINPKRPGGSETVQVPLSQPARGQRHNR